ncbi:hypothetical protein VIBNIFTn2_120136 [Vibrio nigripulchritudo FTn2]|uniref:hypothetical protein n=1 Tax=Vibrio nigripulchritudo TaxID=28173 RepID=UPI0003B21492|nr:hypothetical protein [Vibrio nigripulchritudo]CCN40154.1 hypothetical protein VIBNIFTn2_120136 [Vibrio nigripulchritudo FTn2]
MMMSKEQFCAENYRRFFNRSHCLHVQSCIKESGQLLTLRFQIAPKRDGKVDFTNSPIFQLSAKELTSLCRFLIVRSNSVYEIPFHNGKTLKFTAEQSKGLNVQIIQKGNIASFMIPTDELFSLTGIAVSTLARREMLDSITVLTMIKNGL